MGVTGIPIYWATTYYLKAEKAADYQKWLRSEEAKRIFARIEKESGFKYLNTYFPIFGLGDFDAEDWFVAQDWASGDRVRDSKSWDELTQKTWHFFDVTKTARARVMRTARDVKIPRPPKK